MQLTNIIDLQVFKGDFFKDNRGYTFTTFEDKLNVKFVMDKVITGKKGCLRGFHGDNVTWKYFTCLDGSFDIAIIDLRPGETYLNIYRDKLTKRNRKSILVPPGCANAHQGLSKYILYYKWSEYYNIDVQYSICYNCVPWKHKPILSERDKNSPTLGEFCAKNRVR